MFTELSKKIEQALTNNKSIDKESKILLIIALILYFISYYFAETQTGIIRYLLILLFIFSMTLFVYSFWISRKRKIIHVEDMIIFKLNYIIDKIPEYRKELSDKKKKKILKDIKKKISEIEKYTKFMEKSAQRYIESDFDVKCVYAYRKHIYSLNHSLNKDQGKTLNEKMLDSIKEYSNSRLELRKKYREDISKLIDEKLLITHKAIPDQNKNLGFKFYLFAYKTFLFQALIFSITLTILVIVIFAFVIPSIATFSNDALLSNGVYIWLGIFIPGFVYLWIRNKNVT